MPEPHGARKLLEVALADVVITSMDELFSHDGLRTLFLSLRATSESPSADRAPQ